MRSQSIRGMSMGRTCFLLLMLSILVQAEKRKGHTTRWISGEALKTVAQYYSDVEEFKRLLKPILVPRIPDTTGNTKVREYLIKVMKALNWHIEEDTFVSSTPYGNKKFTNIIATFDPSKPRRFVLAAHYDSKMLPTKFIAATDSAVPCAILLDVAIQLNCLLQKGSGEKARDITPQIVFFDGEEAFKDWTATDSIYGARHLAEKWEKTPHPTEAGKTYLDSITTFVLLDLIGSEDIQFTNFFESTKPFYEVLVKKEKLLRDNGLLNSNGVSRRYPLFTPTNSHRFSYFGGGIEDDHIPFMRKGVPILHLISSPFPRVWHTPQDNEHAINYEVTDNFNRIFRTFVASYLHLDPNHQLCKKKK